MSVSKLRIGDKIKMSDDQMYKINEIVGGVENINGNKKYCYFIELSCLSEHDRVIRAYFDYNGVMIKKVMGIDINIKDTFMETNKIEIKEENGVCRKKYPNLYLLRSGLTNTFDE